MLTDCQQHLVGSYYTDISRCTVNKTLNTDVRNNEKNEFRKFTYFNFI